MIIKNEHHAVYLLLKEGSVVYVGKTINLISRLWAHQKDKSKDFDSVEVFDVLSHVLARECTNIVRLVPEVK